MTELTQWRPLERLLPGFSRSIFGDLMRDDLFSRVLREATGNGDSWTPLVDLTETEQAYEFEGEFPGINPEDIKITLNDNCLEITGEKRKERRGGDGARRIYERSYGAFTRTFKLPVPVDEDSVSAESSNGLLRVTLRKKTAGKSLEIKVQAK